jgi:hypothetical protein
MSRKANGAPVPPEPVRMRAPREVAQPDAAGRFLYSLQLLARSRRLYQKDHPKIEESLDAAERNLRAALGSSGPVAVSVERGQMLFRGRPLEDPRGELKTFADELLRRGISALAFRPETHAGELLAFVELVEGAPAASGGESPWKDWLAKRRIAGIRVNEPMTETRADALLPRILATVLEQRVQLAAGGAQPSDAGEQTRTGLLPALGLLDVLARILPAGAASSSDGAREAAREFERTLASAERPAVLLVAGAMDRHPPRADSGETLQVYFSRLAEEMALSSIVSEYRAGRLRPADLRGRALELGRGVAPLAEANSSVLAPIARWEQERGAAEFELIFWSELSHREVCDALRSDQSWAVPSAVLRTHLDDANTTSALREARAALLSYVRGLESPESSVRIATAAGLSELGDPLEKYWPEQLPEEFAYRVIGALVGERVPAVAAILAAVVQRMAASALRKGRYAEYESIFQAIDRAPRELTHDNLRLVESRLFNAAAWDTLVSGAIARRPLEPSLVRLLARDPEKLLDRLTAILAPASPAEENAALEALPAMVRLIRTIGEPAIAVLAKRVFEKRLGRATAAVKLLAVIRPLQLLDILPQALANWDWSLQDLAIAELARQNTPRLGLTLLSTLSRAHLYVVPMIIDQVGIEGEVSGIPQLLEIAAGANERLHDVFIRIKAVEALGRLQAAEAALTLRTILRRRNGLTYAEPAGLRSAAEEALEAIEGRGGGVRLRAQVEAAAPGSAVFARSRRYPRFPLQSPLPARIEGAQPAAARVRTISLGGACLQSNRRLQVGDSFPVEIKNGLRTIHSMAVVRSVAPNGSGVEFVHMDSDDREKLRRLLRRLSKD